MITSAGVGSGLDVESIVSQLMELEQRPLLNISTQQLDLQAEISALGQLKGALSSFQSAVKAVGSEELFRSFSAVSSDTETLSVTADSTASAGSHDINVTQLAQAHRIASEAFADSDTTAIGTGTLTISVGADSFNLAITAENNTLQAIRDEINGAAQNTGVTASILNVDGGSRLVLSSDETGTAKALTVTITGDGDIGSGGTDTDASGLSRLAYDEAATPTPITNMTQLDESLDAQFTVDTFAVTRSSNTVDDVIEGLTLTLKTEAAATITIGESSSAAVSGVQKVVDSYNSLKTTILQLKAGELEGDSLLRGIESQLRNAFSTPALGTSAEVATAFDAGFTFNDEGVLSLKSADLIDKMGGSMDALVSFFADADSGFSSRIDSILQSYVSDSGILQQRNDGLLRADERLEARALNIEGQLERTEQRIRAEFGALDILVASLETTSNFLLQQLDNLPFNNLGNRR